MKIINLKFLNPPLNIAICLLILLSLAACDNSVQTSSYSGATQANYSPSSRTDLPDAQSTQEVFPTFTPLPAGANQFKPHSLVNVSADQVAQVTIQNLYDQRLILGDQPQLLLARPTTWQEIADFGWGATGSSTIEAPPLMLVILKGAFASGNLGGLMISGTQKPATYLACVVDLWAGVPTIYHFSENGEGFSKALNDSTLPTPAVSQPATNGNDYQPPAIPTAPAHLHYGDTAPGLPASGQPVREGSFGSWHYVAQRGVSDATTPEGAAVSADQVYAEVAFDGSVTAQYLDANRRLLIQAEAGNGTVEIWVAFNKYVVVDQFRSFVQAHQMKTGLSYLRAIDQNPRPIYAPYYTINVVAADNDPIRQTDLDSKLTTLTADPQKQISLKGVYLTHAWVDAKQLAALAADPNVYYVDMTANAVRADLAKAGVAGAEQSVVLPHPELVFNSMVEALLENK